MRNWPLGVKLTAWSALLAGFALVLCGIGAGVFIRQEQIEALDDQLSNEAHTFFGEVARQAGTIDWRDHGAVERILPLTRTKRFVQIVSADGRVLYRSRTLQRSDFAGSLPGASTIRVGRNQVRMGAFAQDGLTLCLGAELSEINADESQLRLAFFVGLPVLVSAIAFCGWWLARKALAPMREITLAAEQITAQRLHQRLPVPRARDEVGRLTSVLNAMFDRLDVSFRQAARFSADASHELKTPLTILRTSIEDLLDSPTLSANDRRAVAGLLEQTRRLSSITESLLLLSRADAGRLKLDLAEADVCEIVTACSEDTAIICEERGITIDMKLPSVLHAAVDTGRLSQILLNLLDNAVKYNRDGGEVKIDVAAIDGGIAISVANTGPGISPSAIPHLFERFFRVNPTPDTPGHGLGLSLARELARAHGGDVTLERSDDEWTVFRVFIGGLSEPHSRETSPAGRRDAPAVVAGGE
ncbi:MAG: two-component system, OmpR family, sensor kinase [Chthoniobacter sp.]|nr:two-component system, OmpR family, sensor kinase [Chthoniobacter sp.]